MKRFGVAGDVGLQEVTRGALRCRPHQVGALLELVARELGAVPRIAYFGCLISMWALWRNKDINIKTAFYVGLGMGIVGAIGTIPTVFLLFGE